MPAAQAAKRRRFKRCTVRILVDYWCDNETGSNYATTLGAGGLFVECEEPFPVGTDLTVRFKLPESEALHTIPGRIAWQHLPEADARSRAPGMAVEFIDQAACSTLARALEAMPE